MDAAHDLAAMDVDAVVESEAKDHQGSSMHASLDEGGSGRIAADPETSTFPSSASEATKKTLSAATACGEGGGGGDYEATGSRDGCKAGQLEVSNQRKRRSDSLASDSASLGGGDGEGASHVCRLCKRQFNSGRALGGHMRAHGSLAMEDGNTRTWNSENVAEKEQQLTSWKAGRGTYVVNPLARLIHSGSDLDSCRDESSPSLASSRPRGTNSCSRSEARRLTKRWRVAAAELGSCQERDDDEDMDEDHEEAISVLLGSSSSEATNSNMQEEFDVTEGTSYMCQICEEEFETARDLNQHKKEHPQYILRMNPKRSQRFIDQDGDHLLVAAATAAAPNQAKKVSSGTPEEKLPISCTECDKKFPSMKALFGHMRCHPERDWRGIQPPERSTAQQAAAAAAAGHAYHGSSRKKRRPPPVILPTHSESESESETDSKPAAGKDSDVDSDTESIEAAYINGTGRHNSGPPGWRTKKRTKRMRQTVRSLQAVTGAAPAAAREEPGPSTPGTETQVQKDIVFALMLLHPKTVAQVLPPTLEQRKGGGSSKDKDSRNVAEKLKAPIIVVDNKSDRHDTHKHHHHGDHDDTKGNRQHAEEAEDHHNALVSNDQDFDEMETGEQQGGTRMMYECATCKRIFKSHQALGGHRASHKKVKGCFARTSINDEEGFGRQDQSTKDTKEDILEEHFLKADQQLPHEHQEPSYNSEEDAESCDYLDVARGDNEEMLKAVRKTKGHECSICHRIFNSGQALGGHKRCHWGGTGTAGPNEATTIHNLNNNNAVMMVYGDQAGLEAFHPIQGFPNPGGHQSKGIQEGIIDLNMPAPECVEDVAQEQSASASASGMAAINYHGSYLPFQTSTVDCAASVIHQPCSDTGVEKGTGQQTKLRGEILDTNMDKSQEHIASEATDAAVTGCRTGDAEAMDQGMKRTEQPIKSRGKSLDTKVDKSLEPMTSVATDAVGFTTGDAEVMDQGMNNFSNNTCDQGFTSMEHLSSHQKTRTPMMGPAPSLTA